MANGNIAIRVSDKPDRWVLFALPVFQMARLVDSIALAIKKPQPEH